MEISHLGFPMYHEQGHAKEIETEKIAGTEVDHPEIRNLSFKQSNISRKFIFFQDVNNEYY